MWLLASFNGGPSDAVAKLSVAVTILLALGVGFATRRILIGGVLGGFVAALTCLIVMAIWGGGVGAGAAFFLFGIGGGVCGSAGGLVGRLVRSWLRRPTPDGDPPSRDVEH